MALGFGQQIVNIIGDLLTIAEHALTDHTGIPGVGGGGGGTASNTVSAETTFGIASAAGAATAYSRGDHTHGSPTLDFGEAGDISTQAFADSAAAGASGEIADAAHKHGMMANPVTAHVAAGDPHTQYAQESALGALAALNTVGTTQIDNDAVTYAKIQNISATDKVLGRSTAGAGDVEEIAMTAAGRALIDDVDATAQRTTLGLGALAVKATIATADIDNDAVTYAKIQNVTTARLLGRSTAGSGDAEEISIGSGLSLAAGSLSASGGSGPVVPGRGVGIGVTHLTVPGVSIVSVGTYGLNTDAYYYQPFVVPTPIAIDQLAIEVTTGSAGTMHLGIYAADENWQPTGAPLCDVTVDPSSNGVKTAVVSLTLAAGRYLFATIMNCTPSVRALRGNNSEFIGFIPALGANPIVRMLNANGQTYGALVNPPPVWDALISGTTPYDNFIFLRISDPSP